jgi:hypothetical protein
VSQQCMCTFVPLPAPMRMRGDVTVEGVIVYVTSSIKLAVLGLATLWENDLHYNSGPAVFFSWVEVVCQLPLIMF